MVIRILTLASVLQVLAMPVIQQYIRPGTIIIIMKAYSDLNNYGYDHCTVIHSQNIMDLVTEPTHKPLRMCGPRPKGS